MNFQISSSLQNVLKSSSLLLNSSDSFVSKFKCQQVHCLWSTVSTGLDDKVVKGHNLFCSICFRRRSSFRMNEETFKLVLDMQLHYLKLNIQVCQVFSDVH